MIRRDESDPAAKRETGTATAAAAATTTWSRSKDPRIVRVSRAFGGKDRHSKVCTVRGLRDRRVRLSVPTAIQLYDLQDRLGLSQPSKVVDWLLDAAKHDIDELPPLQFPQGSFMSPSFHPTTTNFHDFASSQSAKLGFKSNDPVSSDKLGTYHDETRFNVQNQGGLSDFSDRENNFSSIPNYNSYVRSSSLSSSSWDHDPSNLTLNHHHHHHHHNQPSVSLGLTAPQNHDLHNFSFLQSSPSGLVSNRVLVYHQPGMIINPSTQPYFPQTNTEFDPSSGTSNTVRPFQFSMTANLFPWQNNAMPEEDKHA